MDCLAGLPQYLPAVLRCSSFPILLITRATKLREPAYIACVYNPVEQKMA